MKEIDAETMELLLNYIYTGRVSDFKAVSVVELFKVISYLSYLASSYHSTAGCGSVQTRPPQAHV